jgi:serine/threonine protein kinase
VARAATILSPGETLGGFRIVDVIGFGGMAVVYRAEQVSLGRPVALKVLSPQLSSDEAFRERFRREGKHAAALDHPNIVAVYDSGESEGRLYLAMRLVEGTTLGERMHERGLSAQDTIDILRQIARALDVAHDARLVHRDVKPQNILLAEDGHPYLADFGVAKGPQTHGLTATGGFVGSLNYAAPEQILGHPATAAGDVYALTAVLYQCLTGQVPYPRETDAGVMHAHLNEPPPRLLGADPIEAKVSQVIASPALAS